MNEGITVLGLDPGTRHFGWGVVCRVGTRLTHVAHGVVSVAGDGPLGERLVAIESALAEVLTRFSPLEASMRRSPPTSVSRRTVAVTTSATPPAVKMLVHLRTSRLRTG